MKDKKRIKIICAICVLTAAVLTLIGGLLTFETGIVSNPEIGTAKHVVAERTITNNIKIANTGTEISISQNNNNESGVQINGNGNGPVNSYNESNSHNTIINEQLKRENELTTAKTSDKTEGITRNRFTDVSDALSVETIENQTETQILRIRVLKNGIPVPFDEFYVSSAIHGNNIRFKPTTEVNVEVNSSDLIYVNVRLNDDRWLLDRYDGHGKILPNYELEINGKIMSKIVQDYTSPEGKMSANYKIKYSSI